MGSSTASLAKFHKSPNLTLFCTFLFISSIPFSACEIKDVRIADDPRFMILFERFGFRSDGRVIVYVENISYKSNRPYPSSPLDPSRMGFFLVRDRLFPHVVNNQGHMDHLCALSSEYVKPMFRFSDLTIGSTYNSTVVISNPDEYNLVFANCLPDYKVSMTVHTEMYNLHYGDKNFLPAGQTQLPRMYFLIFLTYCGFLAVWVFICVHRKPVLDKIHWWMSALLLFKALKLLCASEDRAYIAKTGTPHGWDIAFYVFAFFKGTLLFTVIALIGTGWSVLRPFLQDREKKVLMTIIPLQVLENMAYVAVEEAGPAIRNPAWWNFVFLVIDLMCCFAVIFPVLWSIRALRESAGRPGGDTKAYRSLEKLTLFRKFYMVVVGYLYFTRVVALALGALLGYRFEWLVALTAEGASLGFYGFVFWNFQPVDKNPYLMIGGESDDNIIEISRIYTLDDEDDSDYEDEEDHDEEEE
ncbi:protein CANDIDATE G-PROTEIN COUPLED RECEPTOR 7-like [Punica granatum]|uniref:Uncharacterized protein n=2 Tax=Punica granatum TaxID=22663 RepID=A0A218WGN2_PUNGR|nr:protein CANDIDATE G-PROTEIN COUPLED RECEPTOR 7-like [Punica granatum]OWM71658.1 hypothetical protein CDL15_Pgr005846 [Punica granatum]PKI41378.1 hypothetical protein CRG98_038264 [Punica granatum]